MYALEHLNFQGTERCPQYRWKQVAICDNRTPLDKVRAGQQRPADWRVKFMPGSTQTIIAQRKNVYGDIYGYMQTYENS